MSAYTPSTPAPYMRLSDMTPDGPTPGTMGYGGIPHNIYRSSTWDIFGMSLPAYPSGSNGDHYVPMSGFKEGFVPKGELPSENPPPPRPPVSQNQVKKTSEADTTETSIDDIDFTKRPMRLKNPYIVFAFLMALYIGSGFLQSGIQEWIVAKLRGGKDLTWKSFLVYGFGFIALLFVASYLLHFSLLEIEEA
jgi:hypothetical protein